MTLQVLCKYGKNTHCAITYANGQLPIAQTVLETCILLLKGYSQKPQHNFPRFLELHLGRGQRKIQTAKCNG